MKSFIRNSWPLLAAFVLITSCGGDTPANNDTTTAAQEPNKKIAGLQPVDVYISLEKQGFTTTEKISSDNCIWDCKNSSAGIDYMVSVYSDDASTVKKIKATAMLTGEKSIAATKPFLKYVSSIPFEGSDPAKVAEWLESNFNNDKQALTIAGVTFTIYAPTQAARVLKIETTE